MKIHREGHKFLLISGAALAVLNLIIILLFAEMKAVWITILTLSILFIIFNIFFFRKHEREIDVDNKKILAAADGKVVAIEEVEENEYFRDTRLQVSVFMSLFNVHSNTYPISGTIKYLRHQPGRFLIASLPKSSLFNERTSVVIETDEGFEIMIRQIAGFVARRIVTNAKPGMKVKQGDELGFIKFGSRVDIFLPPGTALTVGLQDSVHANMDVLAKI